MSERSRSDRERWAELEPILDAAFDLDATERARYLESACGSDAELLARATALVAADGAARGFLEHPTELGAGKRWVDEQLGASPPEAIGPYRIVRSIGSGGMGTVYLAQRDDGQFEQRVAIKLLRARSIDLRDRFLRERQILAGLEHENIARLLDGGFTESGTPYFVMEFVEGEPITDYCDARSLTLAQRLDLFRDVCDAVRFANANLVVHRDLKPSNILVTEAGKVKLLDFGIAKLLPTGEDDPSATVTATHLFTPRYAAPEQIRNEPVTTATDVYALGTVLYELLAGRPLRDNENPASLEALRQLLEEPSAPPSRFASGELHGTVTRELDAICMKALRPEPSERYASAEALRDDLRRLRENRPVLALQGSSAYAARKLLRRHRGTATAAAVILASLLGGSAIALYQARRASLERDRALDAEARARALNDFLVEDMLGEARPENANGEGLTVHEILDLAARRTDSSFRDQPQLEADIRLALGQSFLSLAEYERAREHLRAGHALRREALGEGHADTLSAASLLGEAELTAGALEDAEPLLASTLEAQRASLGPNALATLVTEGRLAELRFETGDYAQAERSFASVLARMSEHHPDAIKEGLRVRRGLAETLDRQRKNAEAEALLRETLELHRAWLGPDHPDTHATAYLLVGTLFRLERLDEARPLAREALERVEALYGPGHPRTLDALQSEVRLYWYDDLPRAQQILEMVLARSRESLGGEDPRTLAALINLAQNASMQLDYARADSFYRQALELSRRIHGEEHPRTLRLLRFLGQFLVKRDLIAEAREVFSEIIQISDRKAARDDADATFLNDYAWTLMTYVPSDMRDPEKALPLAERAVAATGREQIEFLHSLARAHHQLGRLDEALDIMREIYRNPASLTRYDMERDMVAYLSEKEDFDGVERFLRANLAARIDARPSGDPLIAETQRRLGHYFLGRGMPGEAETELRASLETLRVRFDDDHAAVARVMGDLGDALIEQGRFEEAETYLRRSYDTFQSRPKSWVSSSDTDFGNANARLQRLYQAWGRPDAWEQAQASSKAAVPHE